MPAEQTDPFESTIQTPEFYALTPEQQITKLQELDPGFGGNDPQTQGELLNLYRAKYGLTPAESRPGFTGANPPPADPSGKPPSEWTAADAMRYGPPIVAGGAAALVGGGPGASIARKATMYGVEVATDFLSEYFAQGMEGEEDQGKRIRGGLISAGMGVGMFGLTKAGGALGRKIARWAALPKNVPAEAAVTQEILRRYGTGEGSVSIGRIGSTEETLIHHLESVARSGWGGSGRMSRMDIFNQNEVLQGYTDFIEPIVQKMDGDDFGRMLNNYMGAKGQKGYGAVFQPYLAIKKMQYDILDERLVPLEGNVFVNGTDVLEEALAKGEEKLLKMRILPSIDDKEAWKTLSPQQANALKLNINDFYGADENYNNLLSKINAEIKGPLEASLKASDPEAYKAYMGANATWAEFQGQLEKKTIKAMRTKIANEPSTVLKYLTHEGPVYDKLIQLKQLNTRSAELGAKERAMREGVPVSVNTKQVEAQWESAFLRPIKYETVRPSLVPNELTGEVTFDSGQLVKTLAAQREFAGEKFLDEVWGGREVWRELYKFAAADEFMKRAYGDSIFIKLMQAGAFGSTVLGKGSKTASTIIMAPWFLSHIFSNKQLTRMITENAKLGWPARTSGRMLRKILQVKTASEIDLAERPPTAVQYYTGQDQQAPQ